MDFLKELSDVFNKLNVEENYVNGNIDKFIKVLNFDSRNNEEIIEMRNIFLKTEEKSAVDYAEKIARIVHKISLIETILNTKKLEQNKKDLIKIGNELLKVSQEIINMGTSSETNND